MNDSRDVFERACTIAGIDADGARLLRVGSNAVYRLKARSSSGYLDPVRTSVMHGGRWLWPGGWNRWTTRRCGWSTSISRS
jgi:hypothetical protein